MMWYVCVLLILCITCSSEQASIWLAYGVYFGQRFCINSGSNSNTNFFWIFRIYSRPQWHNWTLLYTLAHWNIFYQCMTMLARKSCHLFCQISISLQQIEEADCLILEFCNMFQRMNNAPLNYILHGHLKGCIMDFGPVYFWFFSLKKNSMEFLVHTIPTAMISLF